MGGNSFGQAFRITTFGESHGAAIGVVIDGCPPRLPLCADDVQRELDRRRPGQSHLVSPRAESDRVRIVSGVFDGVTLGTPITLLVGNEDARPADYEHSKDLFRPSHADYTYQVKYGVRSWQGGGRASARETIGRVAAGAVAKQLLRALSRIEIIAYVKRIQDLEASVDPASVTLADVESNPVRCPDASMAARMQQRIEDVRAAGDSLGGIVEAVARQVPPGLGEPVFDKLEADLAKAMLSLPATKGFEIGSGFGAVGMLGSQHNDRFVAVAGTVRTETNRSGGVQGGISNGEPIVIRVAFKPTATILQPQATVDASGKPATLQPRGRHDPCVLPRAVPMVEAMMALVLADHCLRDRGQCGDPAQRQQRRGDREQEA
ncbi:MAG: chorismate synthase [Planctomycetota bacterium]